MRRTRTLFLLLAAAAAGGFALLAAGGGCARSEDVHHFGFRWLGRDVAATVYLWDRTRTPSPRRVVAGACDSVAAALDPRRPGGELARLAAAPPGTVAVSPLLSEALRLLLTPPLPDRPPLAAVPRWRHDPFRRRVIVRRGGAPSPGLPAAAAARVTDLAAGLAVDLAVTTLRDTLGVSRAVLQVGDTGYRLGTAPGGAPWPVAVTTPGGDTLAVLPLVNRAVARFGVPPAGESAGDGGGGDTSGHAPGRGLVIARRAARAAQAAAALARLPAAELVAYLAGHTTGTGTAVALPDTTAPAGWRLLVDPATRHRLRGVRRGVAVSTIGP